MADKQKPEINEIAVAGDFDIFQGFLDTIANPDEVLNLECGGDITVYDNIGRDPRISANLGTRARAVVGKEWNIIPHPKEDKQDIAAADYVKQVLLGFPFDRARRSILRGGTLKGFAVSEVMWDYSEGDTFIKDMRYRHQRRFTFNKDWHLLLKTMANPMGENVIIRDGVPLRKFQHVAFGDEVETPWGIGLGRELYWPWWFKKNDIKFWLKFNDKFAGPTVEGEYEPGASEADQNKLLAAAQAVHSNNAIIHPKGMLLKLIEAARSGSITSYRELVEFLNDEITICILGQTATTTGTAGKLGNEDAQENVFGAIVKADADSLCEAMNDRANGVIPWLVDYQFPGLGRYPQIWIDCEEEEDKKVLAEVTDKLTASLDRSGRQLKPNYYLRVHGIQEEEIEEKPTKTDIAQPAPVKMNPSGKGVVQFADGGDAEPDNADVLAERLDEEVRPHLEGWLTALRSQIDDAGNLVDLRQDIVDAAIDIAPMAAILRDGLLLADLLGRYEVILEGESSLHFAEPEIVSALRLPFSEAIKFFREKVSIPTEKWNDLWLDMHSRGFMIAGAMKGDLLADLRDAIDETISQGLTLREFRQAWDQIVERHGWSYNGGRNWRTRVVYETNTRQAYNSGRWQQMTDPDVLKARPYLLYKHGDSVHPRPLHLAWDGTVLPADDPWWTTHYPQNGWGCKCKVFSVGERDLGRIPNVKRTAAADGTYEWIDKQGRAFTIPNGIDPGFQYNPGAAAKRSYQVLTDRIEQLPPDIAKRIHAEIQEKSPAHAGRG